MAHMGRSGSLPGYGHLFDFKLNRSIQQRVQFRTILGLSAVLLASLGIDVQVVDPSLLLALLKWHSTFAARSLQRGGASVCIRDVLVSFRQRMAMAVSLAEVASMLLRCSIPLDCDICSASIRCLYCPDAGARKSTLLNENIYSQVR